MPYPRPTLSQLRQQVTADITTYIPGADGLLRFSNIGVIGTVLAGLSNLHYGYLDWISKQSNPFTATQEFLESWAALKGIFRENATAASGGGLFTGIPATIVPPGTQFRRGDGETYSSSVESMVDSLGNVTIPAIDIVTGSQGNMDSGVVLTLVSAIAGVNSSGVASGVFTGGSDIETDDSLRSRMLLKFQEPPHGGAEADYVIWARDVPGVTRAWMRRNGFGPGTVVVYVMFDISEASNGGFPQGVDGVATQEPRDIQAVGDQLAVADFIYPLQPVTALVYVCAPKQAPQNFVIKNLFPNNSTMRQAVMDSITDVFARKGSPGGTGTNGGKVYMADISAALDSIPGIVDFIITSPLDDINPAIGYIPVLGLVNFV